ncbi:ATP-binding protein [Streptomyces griseus]|uniref:ATP-binding protein n=1 Tax=Streptomyces griseus TaxID=1911 RepID=UPI00055DAE0F|nr:ATP-binding protein [Streptomyces griseus]
MEGGLIGRADETATLLDLLAPDSTLLGALLQGPDGVGKTVLARVVACLALERRNWFNGGALFLEARGSCDEGHMTMAQATSAILRAMQLLPHRGELTEREQSAFLRKWLMQQEAAGRRVLFVFDDLDEVAAAERLLPPETGHRLLVTTRTRPACSSLTAVELTALSSIRTEELITAVAARTGQFRLSPEEVANLARICGGIPLAAELVAGAAALDRCAAGRATARSRASALAEPRARAAVRASVDLVLRCLPEFEAGMAVRMARHPGPDHGRIQLSAWGGTLTALPACIPMFVRAGLVTPLNGPGGEFRYVMHPLVHEYLRQRDELGSAGQHSSGVSYLLEAYEHEAALLAVCEEEAHGRQGGTGGIGYENLLVTKDLENLVAVLLGAAEPGNPRTLSTARSVLRHLASANRPYETLALVNLCVTAAGALGDRNALAWALMGSGEVLRELGRFEEADAVFGKAEAAYEQLIQCPPEEERTDARGRYRVLLGDPVGFRYLLATVHGRRATAQLGAHLHTQAAAAHQAASEIYVADGQWYDLMTRGPVRPEYQVPWAESLHRRGVALARAHRFLEACSALRQGAMLQRDLEASENEAVALTVLWNTASRANFLAALGVNHVNAELDALNALVTAVDQQDRRIDVEATLRDIVDERGGPRPHPLEALALWGNSLVNCSRVEEGVSVLNEAASRCRGDGRLLLLAEVLDDLGYALFKTRQGAKSVDAHREAVAIWEELADRRGRALASFRLAAALVAAKQTDEAVSLLSEVEYALRPNASDVGPRVMKSIADLLAAAQQPSSRGPRGKRRRRWS